MKVDVCNVKYLMKPGKTTSEFATSVYRPLMIRLLSALRICKISSFYASFKCLLPGQVDKTPLFKGLIIGRSDGDKAVHDLSELKIPVDVPSITRDFAIFKCSADLNTQVVDAQFVFAAYFFGPCESSERENEIAVLYDVINDAFDDFVSFTGDPILYQSDLKF